MTEQVVLYEVRDAMATMTVNRPEKYEQRAPALHVRTRDLRGFFRFLAGKGTE